jgi:hypothetical protein
MHKPNPKRNPSQKAAPPARTLSSRHIEWIANTTMAGVFVICAIIWRIEDSARSPALSPQGIEQLHPQIASVAIAEGDAAVLEIVLDQEPPRYDASAIADLARAALLIAARLKAQYSELPAKQVRLVARLRPAGIGKQLQKSHMLALPFSWPVLMRTNFADGVTFQQLLNSAEPLAVEPGEEVLITGFCRDPVARTADQFCARELSKLR